MPFIERSSFPFALVTVLLAGGASVCLNAQSLQPAGQSATPRAAPGPLPAKPSPSAQSFATPASLPPPQSGGRAAQSMLDEPASPAKVAVTPSGLSIVASNASLTEVLRQVAQQTSMQVEGNSRDERVFGVYGPGSPPDVLSALLYDSGYNVLMVGSGADGMPRRLVLSQRASQTAAATAASVQTARNNDEDDEPEQQEAPPQQAMPAAQSLQPAQAPAAVAPGQVRTPQQMLEELQKMHQGQQPPTELPREPE